jgi:hypothetical protein
MHRLDLVVDTRHREIYYYFNKGIKSHYDLRSTIHPSTINISQPRRLEWLDER